MVREIGTEQEEGSVESWERRRHGSPLIFEDQRAAKRVNNAIEEHGILLEDEDVEIDYFDTPMGEVDVNGMGGSINSYNMHEYIAGK
ncbi:hypothetical protein V6N13_125416 [Hibiscus sabdariffa]